nr:ABC transporter permease subunit [Massilistercora timonensis]
MKQKTEGNYGLTRIAKVFAWVFTLYIILPLFFLILFSFSGTLDAIPKELTLKWYTHNPETMIVSLINTLAISLPATGLGVLVALPLAYSVARMDFKGKRIIDQLIVLPSIIPGTVLGLIFLQIANSSVFSGISRYMIVIVAHTVITVPVIARPIIGALEQNGISAEEAATTLGGKPLYVFRTITFPIISSSMLVGMMFGFARSITDFIMTLFIVPAGMVPMAIQIYNSTSLSAQQITAANATVLLIFTILVVSIAEIIMRRNNRGYSLRKRQP